MRRIALVSLCLFMATLVLLAIDARRRPPRVSTRPAGTAVVQKVVDGDTIDLDIGGERQRARLLGIDTPETVDETRPIQCFGPEASDYVKSLLPPGTVVRLERDVESRDRFGRLLVYVYRHADELFVNQALLEDGFATTLSIKPNTAHAGEFEAAKARATRNKRGLWAACGEFGEPLEMGAVDAATATSTPAPGQPSPSIVAPK